MKTMTATAVARNFSRVLDDLARGGGAIAIERNQRIVGRLVPGAASQTALEALADVYRTLPEEDGAGWEADARRGGWRQKVRDPWRSF